MQHLRIYILFIISFSFAMNVHAQLLEDTNISKKINVFYNQNDSVYVSRVLRKVSKGDSSLNQITFAYKFNGMSSVFIQGLGNVPSEATFKYFTRDNLLVFKDSINGKILAQISLKSTSKNFGTNAAELPNENDFPQFFTSSERNYQKIITEIVINTIQKYFPSGYLPHQENKLFSFTTTFTDLKVSKYNLMSEIAVKICEPYAITNKRISYRVYYIIRDKPRLSDTWRTGKDADSSTLTAAQSLIKELIGDINK